MGRPARKFTYTAALLLALAFPASASPVSASSGKAPAVLRPGAQRSAPGQLLVAYDPGTSIGARRRTRALEDSTLIRRLLVPELELVRIPPGESVAQAQAAYERLPGVAFAEPNGIVHMTDTVPNDPGFGVDWGLRNTGQNVNGIVGTPGADINAVQAWDASTGDRSVTVAVVDTGVDYTHPDLSPNMWVNPGESGAGRETNGIDDDHNGKVDDWQGWDFVNSDNDPKDEHYHGTHVAGIIGAKGNDSTGVAGVSWNVGIMPVRVLDAGGSGYWSDVADGFAYAGLMKADVANASLGGTSYSDAVRLAIEGAPNTLFVFAAGNYSNNNDSYPFYPCSYTASNIICVAATDQNDSMADFSNYGTASVDLGAPGVNVYSDAPYGRYQFLSGTSMAAPHVSGAAALLASTYVGEGPAFWKEALLSTVEPLPGLAGKTVTGGRLNAAAAIRYGDPYPPETTILSAPTGTVGSHSATIKFESSEAYSTFECSLDGAAFSPCNSPATYAGLADGSHHFEVGATDASGNLDQTPATSDWAIDSLAPDITVISPAQGKIGSTVVIQGTNFDTVHSVTFGGQAAAFSADSPTRLSATVPSGAKTGSIVATNAHGSGWSPTDFTVVPANDDFADAQELTGTSISAESFTNAAATLEPGEPDHGGVPGGHSVWFAWTAPVGGPVVVDTTGSGFDTTLSVYAGTAVNALTAIAQNDDDGAESTSKVTFAGPVGTHVMIAVDGWHGRTGPITLHISQVSDTTPPNTTIWSWRPGGPSTDPNASFSMLSSESGSTFLCSLDAQPASPCVSPAAYSGLAAGDHTFAVAAVDPFGNSDPTPDTRAWTVIITDQPDEMIRRFATDPYLGQGVFNTDGSGQTRSATVRKGKTIAFWIKIENAGSYPDSYKLAGCRGLGSLGVTYLAGSKDISRAVQAGRYRIANLARLQDFTIQLRISATFTASAGASVKCSVNSTSLQTPSKKDTVVAVVTVR